MTKILYNIEKKTSIQNSLANCLEKLKTSSNIILNNNDIKLEEKENVDSILNDILISIKEYKESFSDMCEKLDERENEIASKLGEIGTIDIEK